MKPKVDEANKAYEQLQKEFGKYGPGGIYGPIGKGSPPPLYPEPTPLPAAVPVIDLHAPGAVSVALRAQVPAVVRLRGRPELRFSRAVLTLTAKPLLRNLAEEQWGTAVSEIVSPDAEFGSAREYLLPGAQRISALAVKPANAVQFSVREGGEWRTVAPVFRLYFAAPNYTVIDQTVQGDAVRVLYNTAPASVVLRSESEPLRVMLAAGDDTPLQSFPAAVPVGSSVVSRDLAPDLNRAWGGAAAAGAGLVEFPLKITSLTDGIVEVKLEGSWQRQVTAPAVELALQPFGAAPVEVPWLSGALSGSVSIGVAGEFVSGLRWGLAEQSGAGRSFSVRVTENLAIAQAVLLRAGGGVPGPARTVTAVWLALPSVPDTAQTVELKLSAPAGEPTAPAEGAPAASAEATLPADAAAYLHVDGLVWFRVPFARPAELDGSASGQPFFLVCAGREGTLLAHRSVAGAERLPTAPGPGSAMVRNLAWASDWEEQQFDRAPARWVFDLELAPLPDETLLTIGGQAVSLSGGKGGFAASVTVQNPVPAVIPVSIVARAAGTFRLTALAVAPP